MVTTTLPSKFCFKLHRLLTRLILSSPFLKDFSLSNEGLILRAEFETCVQSLDDTNELTKERKVVVH